ncbi:MlaC/ttg2D family ABC transporter substrate-binding protein [Pseudoalteromonas luteoviolacea]|uniref:MlaC/ttg2D family ABC transporter substrate-binding protein n=1 Tax=Pseudoalteromonas luteoviolacea TaxID=43657 RepID=UPI00351DB15C
MKLKKVVSFLFLVFCSTMAMANETPYQLITQVGDGLFADIKKVNAGGKATPKEMRGIVKARLMPHIDTRFVSRKLLGKHIKGLKRQEAIEFIGAVTHYLEVTYASALMQYKGQEVVFEQAPAPKDSKYATVKAIIKENAGPDIDLHFKFRKGKDGQWKVYDLVAEGISLLSAKQKEIVSRISQVGLAQVTTELNGKG